MSLQSLPPRWEGTGPGTDPSVVSAGGCGCCFRTAAPDPCHQEVACVAHQPGGQDQPREHHASHCLPALSPSHAPRRTHHDITAEPKAVTRSETSARLEPRAVLACLFTRPSSPPDGASPQQRRAQRRSNSLKGPSAGWGWAEMLPPPGTQESSWLHAGCWAPQCPTEKERNLHPERVQSKRCWRRLWSAGIVRGAWSRPWSLPRQVPAREPGSHEAREPGGFLPVILVRSLSPRLSPSESYSSTETPAGQADPRALELSES